MGKIKLLHTKKWRNRRFKTKSFISYIPTIWFNFFSKQLEALLFIPKQIIQIFCHFLAAHFFHLALFNLLLKIGNLTIGLKIIQLSHATHTFFMSPDKLFDSFVLWRTVFHVDWTLAHPVRLVCWGMDWWSRGGDLDSICLLFGKVGSFAMGLTRKLMFVWLLFIHNRNPVGNGHWTQCLQT